MGRLVRGGSGVALGAALALTVTLSAACGGGQRPREELIVFAAASLSGVMDRLAAGFEGTHGGVRVLTSLAGSQNLRTQLEMGAPAQVFISADPRLVIDLAGKGIILGPTFEIGRNTLAVLLPKDNRAGVKELRDLARPGVRVVMGGPEVPAGAAARSAIERMGQSGRFGEGFRSAVLANVVSEETSVLGVVSRVILGEADAGFAYVTDAIRAREDGVTSLRVPEEFDAGVTYVAAAIPPGERGPAADFVRFLSTDESSRILEDDGFSIRRSPG